MSSIGRLVRSASIAFALAGVVGGCVDRAQDPLRTAVEGALRASVLADVAPAAYQAGVLAPDLAADWIARGDAEFSRWFAGTALEQHRLGLRNVVESKAQVAGAITASVEVQRIEMGSTTLEGDRARVADAAILYVTHFVPGTWEPVSVPGVTMCIYDLERINGHWRVTDEACNVSGG